MTPQQHPLVELPPRTEPEVPAKPQRDVPFADPPRAGSGGVEMANEDSSLEDTIPVAPIPAATEPLREAWQAPSSRSPWMTQNLRAMPLPIPTMPLPFPSIRR